MVKNLPANTGATRDPSSSPESGRSPGIGNGNSFQYSWQGNPVDTGAWQATVHHKKVVHKEILWTQEPGRLQSITKKVVHF